MFGQAIANPNGYLNNLPLQYVKIYSITANVLSFDVSHSVSVETVNKKQFKLRSSNSAGNVSATYTIYGTWK